jgi:hypothetical protein
MTRKVARNQEALRRARQRQRERDQLAVAPTSEDERRDAAVALAGPRRLAALTCGWCKGPIALKARGRIPKWCSAACRQRAWEQERAARSGRSAVEIVERRVPAAELAMPRHDRWPPLLDELARQLDTGAIYDKDVQPLARALSDVLAAFERRTSSAAGYRPR